MPTANEVILDRYIRHQTYILRYAAGLRNRSLPLLIATEGELYNLIVKWATKAESNRRLIGAIGRRWQTDFAEALTALRYGAWDPINEQIAEELRQFAINEAAAGAAVIEGAVPVVIGMQLPPAAQLIAIANSQPFQGRTLRQWLQATATADAQRLLSYAKNGIVQGMTPTQIARGAIGTKELNYKDGVSRKAQRDLESVLLTLTNGIQQEAKQALYEANSDVIKDELYVATLDSRTTLVCAGNDAKVFKRGKGPIPPLHFRCRSLRVPYINYNNLRNRGFDSRTEKELLRDYASKANIPQVGSRAELPKGHKVAFDKYSRSRAADMVGQVPAQTSYSKWLTNQSVDFQNRVLGVQRAKLFREGKVSLDKFTSRSGDVLTLEELRQLGISTD